MRRSLLLVCLLAITPDTRAILGPAFQAQLGNPSSATADPANRGNYLLQRSQYVLGYNDGTREPNWVSWNFTTTDRGSVDRTDAFAADPLLPAGFTAIDQNSYRNSGYDRGHMCPSADRTFTIADNQATFYMTNMVPQAPDNNQGPWARFEDECRRLADLGNEMLILSGPGGFGGTSIASGVAIPGFTWKVAVVVPLGPGAAIDRITAATRVIAIKMPNIAGIRSTPWQNFITAAAEIERDTGYTFFSALAPSIASALRLKIDGQPAASDSSRLTNLSTRTNVSAGADQPAIVGFVIGGTEAKSVLVRAVGPGLQAFGVATPLPAPRLDLVRSSDRAFIATNTGWSTAPDRAAIANAAVLAGAFPLAAGSSDSAVLAQLSPGNYGAIVSSTDNRSGIALIEVYDLSGASASQQLANLSTRSITSAGDGTLIAGFVVSGMGPKWLLVRAAGPALIPFGIVGTLSRPELTLVSGDRIIAQNAGWSISADAGAVAAAGVQVGAFAFEGGSNDAAVLIQLAPGPYTAQVNALNGTSGVALVEVYDVP